MKKQQKTHENCGLTKICTENFGLDAFPFVKGVFPNPLPATAVSAKASFVERRKNDRPKQTAMTPGRYLAGIFQARRERNSIYSMSAFARDLGISVSLLSRIFSEVRPVSLKFAIQASTALDLAEKESQAFLLLVLQSSTKSAKISKKVREKLEQNLVKRNSQGSELLYSTVEIEHFKALTQWYHLAILNLITLPGFRNDPIWVGNQLGISSVEARMAIERMIGLGLILEQAGNLKRSHKNFFIKTKSSEIAVRKFHQQMINKATDQLQKTTDQDFHRRLINGITFACGSEHIETIKEKIDQFEDAILKLTSNGELDSVYQMNIQFFPLTKTKKKEE